MESQRLQYVQFTSKLYISMFGVVFARAIFKARTDGGLLIYQWLEVEEVHTALRFRLFLQAFNITKTTISYLRQRGTEFQIGTILSFFRGWTTLRCS